MTKRRLWPKWAVLAPIAFVLLALASILFVLSRRDDVEKAALREGVVEVWSTTDSDKVEALIADFQQRYPGVRVAYKDVHGSDLQADFLAAEARGRGTADLLWSSAMDLQIKLVNDGYAATYASREAAYLPDWAKWKEQAWGVTAEPIVIVYNKRLISPTEVPTSHIALRRYLEGRSDADRRIVAAYDPEQSAVGYLYLSQDAQASSEIWSLVRAMARNGLRLHTSAEAVLRDVSSGRAAIGYNIAGSYALDEMDQQSDLGVILPQDYTLVMSRIAMIPEQARHPAAARLFLDFLLSREGQDHLAERHITPARSDAILPTALRSRPASMRAIRVGPGLLVSGDRLTREHFLAQWRTATQPRP